MKAETPNEQLKRLLKEHNGTGKKKSKQSRLAVQTLNVDGVTYDSRAELRYENRLKLLVRIEEVVSYWYHVPFPLIAHGGELVGYYEADFVVEYADGRTEVHDVKGNYESDLFTWKARHFKAQYRFEIILIDSTTLLPKVKSA
jgi:hypothetical protein